MTLAPAAATGDRLVALRQLRAVLAAQIDACESARDLAALSRQFTDVLAQIAELESGAPAEKTTVLEDVADEVAARRRRRTASGSGRS